MNNSVTTGCVHWQQIILRRRFLLGTLPPTPITSLENTYKLWCLGLMDWFTYWPCRSQVPPLPPARVLWYKTPRSAIIADRDGLSHILSFVVTLINQIGCPLSPFLKKTVRLAANAASASFTIIALHHDHFAVHFHNNNNNNNNIFP